MINLLSILEYLQGIARAFGFLSKVANKMGGQTDNRAAMATISLEVTRKKVPS